MPEAGNVPNSCVLLESQACGQLQEVFRRPWQEWLHRCFCHCGLRQSRPHQDQAMAWKPVSRFAAINTPPFALSQISYKRKGIHALQCISQIQRILAAWQGWATIFQQLRSHCRGSTNGFPLHWGDCGHATGWPHKLHLSEKPQPFQRSREDSKNAATGSPQFLQAG